jgi:hypothetical protein
VADLLTTWLSLAQDNQYNTETLKYKRTHRGQGGVGLVQNHAVTVVGYKM